ERLRTYITSEPATISPSADNGSSHDRQPSPERAASSRMCSKLTVAATAATTPTATHAVTSTQRGTSSAAASGSGNSPGCRSAAARLPPPLPSCRPALTGSAADSPAALPENGNSSGSRSAVSRFTSAIRSRPHRSDRSNISPSCRPVSGISAATLCRYTSRACSCTSTAVCSAVIAAALPSLVWHRLAGLFCWLVLAPARALHEQLGTPHPSARISGGQRHHCVRSAAAPAALRRHVHARLNHPHHQRGSITRRPGRYRAAP